MIIDQFDEMLEQSQAAPGSPPLVLGIALHPYIVGQPFRLRHLKRALKHIATKSKEYTVSSRGWEVDGCHEIRQKYKVWLTTAGDIALHAEQLPGGTDDR